MPKGLPTLFLPLPVAIFIPHQQLLHRLEVEFFGGRLCPCQRALAGEGEVESLADGSGVDILVGDAALYGGHRSEQSFQSRDVHPTRRLRQVLLASQARQAKHGADVGLRVVLGGWRPSADDGGCVERLTDGVEVFPIRLQCFPRGTITVCHSLELHECRVCLLHPGSLPSVFGVTDVERVVVSYSSCHF